jgi:hypothetical protein
MEAEKILRNDDAIEILNEAYIFCDLYLALFYCRKQIIDFRRFLLKPG